MTREALTATLALPLGGLAMIGSPEPGIGGVHEDCTDLTFIRRSDINSSNLASFRAHRPLVHWVYDPTGAPTWAPESTFLPYLKSIISAINVGTNFCSVTDTLTIGTNFHGTTTALEPRGTGECPASHESGVVTVGWFNSTSTALGMTCYNTENPSEADILMNAHYQYFQGAVAPTTCVNQYSLRHVIFHEAGHALGLDHVGSTHLSSIMLESLAACDYRLTAYGSGDVFGIKTILVP